MTRNLLKELTEPRRTLRRPASTEFACSLGHKLECCKGRGYQLDNAGPFVSATLCRCVQVCKLCYGSARKLDGDGHAQSCQEPSPVRQVGLINEAGIPSRYIDARLEYFSNFSSGNGKETRERLVNWCHHFGGRHRSGTVKGLVLWGGVGIGKTYLLCSTAFELMRQGYTVRFIDFFQLLMELRAAYSEKGSDASILRPLLNVDVLFIDELGKGRNTDWELSILDQLVMGRYNQNKLIMASTNYNPKVAPDTEVSNQDLDKYKGQTEFLQFEHKSLEARVGKRIFSRLKETTTFWHLQGDDFRAREPGNS